MASRWFSPLSFFCLLCLILSPPNPAPLTASPETAVALPDEAHWKNGDLVPPLPQSESVRAEAIARVEAAARARVAAQPGVKLLPAARVVGRIAATGPVEIPAGSPPSASVASADARAWQAVLDRIHATLPAAGAPAVAPASDASVDGPVELRVDDLPALAGIGPQTGINDTGRIPASPDIAVGQDRVMIVTNDRFHVRDRCGFAQLDWNFAGLFGVADFAPYDPRVVYDEWNNRFIMAYQGAKDATKQSFVYLAVSTNGLAQAFYLYTVPVPAVGNLSDDMSIAVSPTGIYVTIDEYDYTTFALEGGTIVELDKADAYAGNPLTVYAHRGLTHVFDATLAIGVRPAQMHSFPGAVYFAASKHNGGSTYTLWTLTGPPGGSVLSSVNANDAAYARAPNVQQPDLSLIRVIDSRIMDAVYDAGDVYGAFTAQRPGIPSAASANIVKINTTSLATNRVYIASSLNTLLPALDMDDNARLGVFFTTVTTTDYLSGQYLVFSMVPSIVTYESGVALAGQANYNAGSAPHRWGNYSGVARDPLDDRTFWMHGAYAATPASSWKTGVYMVNTSGLSTLDVTPLSPLATGGPEGGPFSQAEFSFELQNNGDGTANWRLVAWPSWSEPEAVSGTVAPYSSQVLTLDVSPYASSYAPGLYQEFLEIQNCSGSGGWTDQLTLAVGTDAECAGTTAYTFPLNTLPTLISVANNEPGVYITAIEDAHLCSIGMYADIDAPGYASAAVYEANGTTRGPLVWASGSWLLYNPDPVFHYFPADLQLEACKEYEVVCSYVGPWTYPAFDETLIDEPFDAGSLVRVRDGSVTGAPGPNVLPPMVLITEPEACPRQSNLADATTTPSASGPDRGVFVTATSTRRLCSVQVDDLVAAAGTRVIANVYEASGGFRQGLVSSGSAVSPTNLPQSLAIGVSAQLLAGKEYEVAVTAAGTVGIGVEAFKPVPYSVDWFDVTAGSQFGATSTDVTDLTLGWTEDVSGYPADISKPGPPPTFSASGAFTEGVYVTSLIAQEIYSLGIFADVAAGETVTANIYAATGTTRGSLLTTGTVESGAGGERWHDVPVAVSFLAAGGYDLEIAISDATQAMYWTDDTGLPYTAWSIQVRDAEFFGNAAGNNLHHFRLRACNATLTPVDDGPVRTPMFLADPVPNPTGGDVRFGYSLEEEGPVELAIYDVAGRLVERVFQHSAGTRGQSEVRYDTSRLASGVYFAKLATPGKSLSRKFVVTR